MKSVFSRVLVTLFLTQSIIFNPVYANPPVPPPANDAAARSTGLNDGTPDGRREGQERGFTEGTRQGNNDGYRDGFERCERQEKDRAYQVGYGDGTRQGNIDGDRNGARDGATKGDAQGRSDGYADGVRRADNDALRDSTPPGRAQGEAQAEQSDARSKGRADGLVSGDRDALAHAKDYDYNRGRKDYKAERYSEDSVSDAFIQKAGPSQFSPNSITNSLQSLALFDVRNLSRFQSSGVPRVNPDYRYRAYRHNYPNASENNAYVQGYQQGYDSGFQMAFQNQYLTAYNANYPQGDRNGCAEAQRRDYSADRNRGYQEGYNVAYKSAYDSRYQTEYHNAYNSVFPVASQEGYNATYKNAYNKHFEEARAQAYRERYDALYSAAYHSAYNEKYAQVYPGYAAKYYQIGRSDEAQDFKDRPLRLTHLYVTEMSPNGVYEPGEQLRLKFIVRNFDAATASAQGVKLVVSSSSNAILVTKSSELLAKSLKPRSVTTVSEALGFEVKDGASGALSVKLSVYKDGKLMDESEVNFSSTNVVTMAVGSVPVLKEGETAQIPVTISNKGNAATADDLSLTMRNDSLNLDIQQATLLVGRIEAGQQKTIYFSVVPQRISSSQVSIPLVIEANGGGRKLGSLSTTVQATVSTSYQIQLASSILHLREGGVYDLKYQITNGMGRDSQAPLQVTVRINSAEKAKFQISDMMPIVINSLKAGEKKMLEMALRVSGNNSGGTIEVIIMENNRIVSRTSTAF